MKKYTWPRLYRMALFMLLVFASLTLRAGHEKFNVRQSAERVTTGLEMTVTDDKYSYMVDNGNWSSSFVNHSITNKITLAFDPYAASSMSEAFTVVAFIEVEYDVWDVTAGGFVKRIRQQELSINYTVAGPYKDKSTLFIDNGGNRVTVKVLDFYTSPSTLSFVPNIELVAEVDVERFYTFNAKLKPRNTLSFNESTIPLRNELLVTWDMVRGAEEYDVEWVWINNYGQDGTTMQPGDIKIDPAIFRLNSTRITTTNTYLNIPMIYEQGYILVRFRPIGKDPLTNYKLPLYGGWTSEVSDCGQNPTVACWPNVYSYSGFSNNGNWQASVDYIEEGKNKPRIDYYDATLISRQQQIRLNEIDKVLVGETVYDREGRGAINILPVPSNKQNLDYVDQFNKNAQNRAYSYQDFEGEESAGCPTAEPLSTASGASNYYSPENPNKQNQQSYLPDAFGYSFVQSTFTPDKLGRMKAQSFPGKDHKIGSGHEIRYYYGTPYQEELDRLFGHDVGLYKNYRKNTMIDPNGQVQVTYVDANDRVIASALAGDSPANLEALDGVTSREVIVDLLQERNETEITSFTKSHLVTKHGNHDMYYQITGTQFEVECDLEDVDERCYTCVVDISMNVLDECGDQILSPLANDTQTTTVGTVSPDCVDQPGSFEKNETLTLSPGAYSINRMVSINQPALDAYTEDYLDPEKNKCLLTIDHFMEEEVAGVDLTGCNITCESCLDSLGVYDNWSSNPYNKDFNPSCEPCMEQSEYDAELEACNALCNNESRDCEGRLGMLLSDVDRHGQYGSIRENARPGVSDDGDIDLDAVMGSGTSDFNPENFPLSVFNENNVLPGLDYDGNHYNSWRTPFDPRYISAQYGPYNYRDAKGEVVLIEVHITTNEDGSLRYVPDMRDALKSSDHKAGVKTYILVEDLKYVSDFLTTYWKDEYKWALVAFHPEYGYYEECVQRQASNTFDLKLMSIETIEKAYEFLNFNGSTQPNPLSANPATAIDPYFNSDLTINPTYKLWERSVMNYQMNNYISDPAIGVNTIWKMAHITANCPLYEASETSCPNCFDTYDGINTDEEWTQFKGYYFGMKQNIQAYKSRLNAIKKHFYNGCIGAQDFDPGSLNIFDFEAMNGGTPGAFTSPVFTQYLNPEQLCNFSRADLFKDKVQRFPNGFEATGFDTKGAQCYESIPVEAATENGQIYTADFPVLDEISQCKEKNEDMLKQANVKAEAILYEMCGQCPIAVSLQMLLDGIAKDSKDQEGIITRKSRLVMGSSDINPQIDPVNPSFYLSCYPFVSQYGEFTPTLEKALALEGTDEIYWVQTSNSSEEINASILRTGNQTPCNITLKIDPTSEYSIEDIRGVCCFHYEENPQLLAVQSFKNFSFMGVVNVDSPKNGEPNVTKVPMEGMSCLNIAECPMPPVCRLLSGVESIESVLDLMAVQNKLFSTVNLSTTSPYDVLTNGKLGLIGSGSITWSAVQSGKQMTGRFTTSDGGEQTIQLVLPPDAAIDFNAVTGFEGIEVNNLAVNQEDTDKQFFVYAMATLPDGTKTSYKVDGKASFSIAECREVGTESVGISAKNIE